MLSYFETSESPHRTNPHSPFPSNNSRRNGLDLKKAQVLDNFTSTLPPLDAPTPDSHIYAIGPKNCQHLPLTRKLSLRTCFHLNRRYGVLHLVGLGTVLMAFPPLFRTPTNNYFVLTLKQCHHVTTTRSRLVQQPLVHGTAGYLPGC